MALAIGTHADGTTESPMQSEAASTNRADSLEESTGIRSSVGTLAGMKGTPPITSHHQSGPVTRPRMSGKPCVVTGRLGDDQLWPPSPSPACPCNLGLLESGESAWLFSGVDCPRMLPASDSPSNTRPL